ncbi:MAG: KUP/HAK/KT family potassium transporter [Proteobacteria bacterium]|nr:KUP/HAK/KT family potassium transporter [Pseudomonadota bacterium]
MVSFHNQLNDCNHPFYAMVPSWAMIPTVLLSTLATIIASQAVISGAFSLTRQAIQTGYLPRLNIQHTSPTQIGPNLEKVKTEKLGGGFYRIEARYGFMEDPQLNIEFYFIIIKKLIKSIS